MASLWKLKCLYETGETLSPDKVNESASRINVSVKRADGNAQKFLDFKQARSTVKKLVKAWANWL